MKREVVNVNREMSIITIKKTTDDGKVEIENVNLNEVDKDQFLGLCDVDIDSVNEAFLAEIDLMLENADNDNVREDYTAFLVIRERLVEKYILSQWQNAGEQIEEGEEFFDTKPSIKFADITIFADKKTNEVSDVVGFYTPEFFKPYSISFGKLNKKQKYGFIQSLPKELIDEKMFEYFCKGGEAVLMADDERFTKRDIDKYLSLKRDCDMEKIFAFLAKNAPELHEYAVFKTFSDEPNA